MLTAGENLTGGFAQAIARLLLDFIALFVRFFRYVLIRAILLDSQRAEYMADGLAAGVAGQDALVSTLAKTVCAPYLNQMMTRYWKNNQDDLRLKPDGFGMRALNTLSREMSELPTDRRAEYMHVMEQEVSSIDLTHPPTKYRIAFLSGLESAEPKMQIDARKMALIDAEFELYLEPIGRKLLRLSDAMRF